MSRTVLIVHESEIIFGVISDLKALTTCEDADDMESILEDMADLWSRIDDDVKTPEMVFLMNDIMRCDNDFIVSDCVRLSARLRAMVLCGDDDA